MSSSGALRSLISAFAAGLSFIPAPKPKLPGHEASYNPPKEYLPTEVRRQLRLALVSCNSCACQPESCIASRGAHALLDHSAGKDTHSVRMPSVSVPATSCILYAVWLQEERAAHELLPEDERPDFVPRAFDSLRLVPSYAAFIKERFERCAFRSRCSAAAVVSLHVSTVLLQQRQLFKRLFRRLSRRDCHQHTFLVKQDERGSRFKQAWDRPEFYVRGPRRIAALLFTVGTDTTG